MKEVSAKNIRLKTIAEVGEGLASKHSNDNDGKRNDGSVASQHQQQHHHHHVKKGITHLGLAWTQLRQAHPRLLYGHSTLSCEESDSLVQLVSSRLQRSFVNGGLHGTSIKDNRRTSSGIFLVAPRDANHPSNIKLRERISSLVGLPMAHSEPTQILRYEPGQRYAPHLDTFKPDNVASMSRGGQRLCSVITWLNYVKTGGETIFLATGRTAPSNTFSETGPQVLKVHPKKGDSVVFYDLNEDWSIDPAHLHGGEPPGEGSTKYVAVLWFHPRAFH